MLNAIIHGKKKGSTFEGLSLHIADFSGSEDLATSIVFERLAYLPNTMFGDLISGLPSFPTEIKSLGEFHKIFFWPNLKLVDSDKYVQPDVIIIFDEYIVIIEAKRKDNEGLHTVGQLVDEVTAVSLEYPGRSIILIALAGILHDESHVSKIFAENSGSQIWFIRSYWREIEDALKMLVQEERTVSEMCIIQDILDGMVLMGIDHREPLYFGTLGHINIGTTIFPRLKYTNNVLNQMIDGSTYFNRNSLGIRYSKMDKIT